MGHVELLGLAPTADQDGGILGHGAVEHVLLYFQLDALAQLVDRAHSLDVVEGDGRTAARRSAVG